MKVFWFFFIICIFAISCIPITTEENIPVIPKIEVSGNSTTFLDGLTDSIHPFQAEELSFHIQNPRGLEFTRITVSYQSQLPIIINEVESGDRLGFDVFPERGVFEYFFNCAIPITKLENEITFYFTITDLNDNITNQEIQLKITENNLFVQEFTQDTTLILSSKPSGILLKGLEAKPLVDGLQDYNRFNIVWDVDQPNKFFSPQNEDAQNLMLSIYPGTFTFQNTSFIQNNLSIQDAKELETDISAKELFYIYPEDATDVVQLSNSKCTYYRTEDDKFGVICLISSNSNSATFYIK